MSRAGARLSAFAGLTASDRRLLVLAGLVTLLGIALGILWTNRIHNDLPHTVAEHSAIRWGDYLQKNHDMLQIFVTGALTEELRSDFTLTSPQSDVFGYKLNNSNGVIIAASEPKDIGHTTAHPRIFADVAEGKTHVVAKLTQRLRLPDAADLPTVVADDTRLRQILLNLLSSAIKFTPAGGEIEVAVFAQAPDGLAIAIRDSGVGISAVDLQLLGEPFRQFGKAQPKHRSGTGLGVSLAQALAVMHGAHLDYRSELGTGTTATLVLPARRVLGGAAAPLSARSGS